MVDIGAIGQKYVGNGPPELVFGECLECDFLPIAQF
jgi:hypothetical protein